MVGRLNAQNVGAAARSILNDALGIVEGLQSLISDKATSQAVQAVQREAQATSASLQAQILSALSELRGADAYNAADVSARVAALAGSKAGRPGDLPVLFTASKAGLDTPQLPVWPGPIASTPGGATARLIGAGVIAQRGYTAVEPGRVYRPRAVYWRTSDVSDPAGDAIRFGLLWFDANKRVLASKPFTRIKDATQVRVAYGRQTVSAGMATAAGARVDFVAAPGAAYCRAYIETYGQDGVTDVAVLEIGDVTDATLLDPVSTDVVNRVSTLESQNTGSRLAALESQAGNPNGLTYATRGDAANSNVPSTVQTLTVLGLSSAGDGGADTYRRALAGETVATGASVLGFTTKDGAAWLRTVTGPTGFVTPLSFPGKVVPAPGGLDWKQAIEAAAASAVAQGRPLLIDRSYTVTSVTLPRGTCIISSGGEFFGIATTPTNCILDLPAGNVRTGGLSVWGNYNLNYARGAHYYGQQIQFSYIDLFVGACQIALTIGKKELPFAIVSENKYSIATYGCPGVIEVIGTETLAQFTDNQASADLFGAPASWSSLEVFGIKNVGAGIRYIGGELICTALTYGYIVKMYPLDSTRPTIEGTRYGWTVLSGVCVETASPLAFINNPEFLTINSTSGQIGRLLILDCNGFTSQDATFVYVAPDFNGVVKFDSPDFNFPAGNKAQPTVFCAGGGAATYVDMPDEGIGPGFPPSFASVVGGIMLFKWQQICRAFGTNQAVPTGDQIIKFTSRDYTGAGQRFANFYDPATGYFTVPTGGLASIQLNVTIVFANAATAGVVDIVDENNVPLWAGPPIASGRASLPGAFLGSLPAGKKFAVRANVTAAANTNSALSQMYISAKR